MYKYPPLQRGELVRRYKRFFVDILTEDGDILTVHNPNTGSMKSLLREGNPVLYSTSDNPKRKLAHTLELIQVDGEWIVSNTIRVNQIVQTALQDGEIKQLYTNGSIQREFAYKDSRIDFLLTDNDSRSLVEVKSVTFFDKTTSYFPDAVTTRGKKHLYTLRDSIKDGYRAVMLYVCMANRPTFTGATEIDPEYCTALAEVKSQGVETIAVFAPYDEKTNSLTIAGTISQKPA